MHPLTSPQTISQICTALTQQGYPNLAKRIAYFASDEDLEEGDVPVTFESVLGFWEFLSDVESEGKLVTSCTAEGQVCADWRFEDARIVAIWFLDFEKVRIAASYAPAKWVEIDGGGEIGSRKEATKRLVEAGLFTWQPKNPVNRNLVPSTTLPDTAGDSFPGARPAARGLKKENNYAMDLGSGKGK